MKVQFAVVFAEMARIDLRVHNGRFNFDKGFAEILSESNLNNRKSMLVYHDPDDGLDYEVVILETKEAPPKDSPKKKRHTPPSRDWVPQTFQTLMLPNGKCFDVSSKEKRKNVFENVRSIPLPDFLSMDGMNTFSAAVSLNSIIEDKDLVDTQAPTVYFRFKFLFLLVLYNL